MPNKYQQLVNLLLEGYAKQLSIKNVPMIFTTKDGFNKADTCGGTKIGRRLKASEHDGLYCDNCRIIYINSKNVKTASKISWSIVHELIHCKWFNMSHGNKFEARIRSILLGQCYK